jgi:toxin ParE1/3/4
MSCKLRITHQAAADIEHVLRYTYQQFGQRKHDEYQQLIRLALHTLTTKPEAAPSKARPEIHPEVRTLHLARRKMRARHFILYRVSEDEFVDVLRLLHDAMDIGTNLPNNL